MSSFTINVKETDKNIRGNCFQKVAIKQHGAKIPERNEACEWTL